MARRVFLHVGTPKTGTTYLQTIMWRNRRRLRKQGVLFPGTRRVDHLHASLVICGATNLERRDARAPGAWDRLLREVRAFDGTAIISHEDFGQASAEQARGMIDQLAPAEIHVVVTARDSLRVLPGLWQEHVKFGSAAPLAKFGTRRTDNPLDRWGWRSIDTAKVLERWGGTLPPERVHVVTVPGKGAPQDLLWRRFAGLIGVDPDSCDISKGSANTSLGVVEVELLRRVNTHLGPEFRTAPVAGRWLRGYLADHVLAQRAGQRYGPDPEQEALLRKRSVEMVDAIRDAGYDVIGDLDDLLPSDPGADWRHPDTVTSDELAEAGAETIARLLTDMRELSRQLAELRGEPNQVVPRAAGPSTARTRLRRRLARAARRLGLRS